MSSSGQQANYSSYTRGISRDGRFVIFDSLATNLDPLDPDWIRDVYVRDRQLGVTTFVSHRLPGSTAPKIVAYATDISADGRFVAFMSPSADFVPGDTNGLPDVFLWDALDGSIRIVSTSEAGVIGDNSSQSGTLSDDGTKIAFESAARNLTPPHSHQLYQSRAYWKDLVTGEVRLVHTTPTGESVQAGVSSVQISGDGTHVAVDSIGIGLSSSQGPHGYRSIYVRDMATNRNVNSGLTLDGKRGNHDSTDHAISTDARFVVFKSWASNMVPGKPGLMPNAYLRDRVLDTLVQIDLGDHGQFPNAGIIAGRLSADGNVVAFSSNASNLVPEDPYNDWDIYVVSRDFAEPSHYCRGGTTPQGCAPRIDTSNLDVPDRPSGPTLCVRGAPGGSKGLLLYSIHGPAFQAFTAGGWICVRPPYAKQLLTQTGLSTTCGGEFDFDFASYIDSGVDPQLVPG
ncbi:MAG: PD40 domain-containing protein, partial [Planctomycetes bacterium]|nr:PD40 domain-containing protein [Planctomycetota bacterium]